MAITNGGRVLRAEALIMERIEFEFTENKRKLERNFRRVESLCGL
jgi:hypothetical protein